MGRDARGAEGRGSHDDAAPEGVSRRRLLQTAGLAAAASALQGSEAFAREVEGVRVEGPDAVPVELELNGKTTRLSAEPRATLLEALRLPPLHQTGAKPVCDRAQCGACTVWIDGRTEYACTVLAVEVQGRKVTTVEGLATNDGPAPIQDAFVREDALQCGFCTPGMVMSCAWAVGEHGPRLTAEQVKAATAGNLCRCGTYPHVVSAALRAVKGS